MNDSDDVLQMILSARELRVNRQKDLLERFGHSLVCFTLNIPGPDKNGVLYEHIHQEGLSHFFQLLKEKKVSVIHWEVEQSILGMEGYISVDLESALLKRMTIEIEDKHPLGRIFDFDVFDCDSSVWSRTSLGKERRKCLLCEDTAILCARSRRHSLEDLMNKINNMGKAYFNK